MADPEATPDSARASRTSGGSRNWPRQRWFDRTFAFPIPIELFRETVERLRGTPGRLEERLAASSPEQLRAKPAGTWSIQENAGHLLDLEPLWLARARDLAAARPELSPADLQNRATHDAAHNEADIGLIVAAFRRARRTLIETLDTFTPDMAHFSSKHPRLGTPMTVVDLAFFVAEHDDHHLVRIAELID